MARAYVAALSDDLSPFGGTLHKVDCIIPSAMPPRSPRVNFVGFTSRIENSVYGCPFIYLTIHRGIVGITLVRLRSFI